jgi:hypothetical protein
MSRTVYVGGEIAQCDFWSPDITLPAGPCRHAAAGGDGLDTA